MSATAVNEVVRQQNAERHVCGAFRKENALMLKQRPYWVIIFGKGLVTKPLRYWILAILLYLILFSGHQKLP